jgi:hypothetical protein
MQSNHTQSIQSSTIQVHGGGQSIGKLNSQASEPEGIGADTSNARSSNKPPTSALPNEGSSSGNLLMNSQISIIEGPEAVMPVSDG